MLLDETYEQVRDLTIKLGKTPLDCNDSPGFVSNRVLMPMINEAIFALYEGVATRESIDGIMKLNESPDGSADSCRLHRVGCMPGDNECYTKGWEIRSTGRVRCSGDTLTRVG